MNKTLFWANTAALLFTACTAGAAGAAGAPDLDASSIYADPSGALQTINANGPTNTNGAFFQSLGTNGRSCSTCHVADQAMSMSPPQIRERFAQTHGRDPLFAAFDGANCPNGNTSDAAAHSLLLSHGLIRIGLTVPANAQFTVTVVHDPYGCALVAGPSGSDAVDLSPAAADHQSALLEHDHVRWARIAGRGNHGSRDCQHLPSEP